MIDALPALPPVVVGLIAGAGTVAVVAVVAHLGRQWLAARGESDPADPAGTTGESDALDGVDGVEEVRTDGAGTVVEAPPPEMRTADLGIVQELYRLWREHRKRRKLVKRGYVQWYLVGGTWPVAKFVKPEYDGEGQRVLEHDGEEYLFPPEARLPSEQQGMWTYLHEKGDAVPINLSEPGRPAVEADALKEYLDMGVSATPPSWFDQFDLDVQTILRAMVMLIIGYAIAQQFLGGGGVI